MLAYISDHHLILEISPGYALITTAGLTLAVSGLLHEYMRRKRNPTIALQVPAKWQFFAFAIGLLVLAPTNMAFAQGTFLQGFLTFTTGAVATTLSTLAVLLIGAYMASHRASPGTIALTTAGIWVMGNAGNIQGWVHA